MNPTFPIVALACDYDETLAFDGRVEASTVEALVCLKGSGAKLLAPIPLESNPRYYDRSSSVS
jgi:hypothetical protein